jgi:phage terminase small subunit
MVAGGGMERNLTYKQKKFIEIYAGNATKAAIAAGYSPKTAYAIGVENLKKPQILKEIQARNGEESMGKIANRQERQAFWTKVMNDLVADLSIRLRASELLGKSEADFTEKIQSGGLVSDPDFVEKLKAARERVTTYMKAHPELFMSGKLSQIPFEGLDNEGGGDTSSDSGV